MSENFFHGDLSVPEEDAVYFLSFKSCGKKSFENHSTYWFTLFTNLKTASDELNITIHLK